MSGNQYTGRKAAIMAQLNEAREYLGLNPIDGGDELLRPLNQAPAVGAPDAAQPESPATGTNRVNGDGANADILN